MSEIEFEWDPRKDRANQAKHGVSFSEAATAFYDENGYLLDDPDHSHDEDHFVLLGLSSALRLLVVVHCFRDRDATIRIISARKANPSETTLYDRELRP
jgi:uncharacterized DUF497 family protein